MLRHVGMKRLLTSRVPVKAPRMTRIQCAPFATANARPAGSARTIRIPRLPILLVGVSLACLGVGLYEYFTSDIQKYPPDIRQALRKALYYETTGKDLNLAIQYFRQALELALASDSLERNGAPLTGIMIQLGTLFERLQRLPEARQTLILALRHLSNFENDDASKPADQEIFNVNLSALPPSVQRKMMGIAQKLGDICDAMKHDQEAEKWYVWSVEHMIRVSSRPVSEYGDSDQVLFNKEHMPSWLTNVDLGASLESLGSFYSSRQKYSFAIQLYLKALDMVGLESCRAAVLMNNLGEIYAAQGLFDEAKIWTQKGLDIAQNPNVQTLNKSDPTCNECSCTLLFNMGMLFEQTNDKEKAIQLYEQARNHGREQNLAACMKESHYALKRIQYEQARREKSV